MRVRVLLGGKCRRVSKGSMDAESTRGKPFTAGNIGSHLLKMVAKSGSRN